MLENEIASQQNQIENTRGKLWWQSFERPNEQRANQIMKTA